MNVLHLNVFRPKAATRPLRPYRPRITCVHLLSRPQDEREVRSVADVGSLHKHGGISVVKIVNPPYDGLVPAPRHAHDRPFSLTPRHYGAWLAHKDAITRHLVNVDGLLVCECDCVFCHPVERMVKLIHRALEACQRGNLTAFTLGFRHDGKTIDRIGEDVIVIDQFVCCHCYLIPLAAREVWLRMLAKPWDTFDYCTTVYLCDQWKCRIGAFADRPAAVQADGYSICAERVSTSERHYRSVRN